jgi:uncharacterized protein YciI/uncharacterized protein YndB with AHSA1/START domain
MTSWLCPAAKIQPWVGGSYELYFGPEDEPGTQGSDGCKVMTFQPMEMLSFSWNAPPHIPDLRHQHTMVVLHFSESSEGTEVKLSHIGWGQTDRWNELYEYFDKAWTFVFERLRERFEKGPADWKGISIRSKKDWLCIVRPSRPDFLATITAEESSIVSAHFAYLKDLLAQGRLVLAGRTQTDQPEGYSIFQVETEEMARSVVAADPAVVAGVFVAELYPYSVAISR